MTLDYPPIGASPSSTWLQWMGAISCFLYSMNKSRSTFKSPYLAFASSNKCFTIQDNEVAQRYKKCLQCTVLVNTDNFSYKDGLPVTGGVKVDG